VVGALTKHVRKLPQQLRRSLTWDRGKEMADHKSFTVATNVQVYFCDPRSPWQRGSNEIAAAVFPEGNRSLTLLATLPEQDRAAAQSTPPQDLGLRPLPITTSGVAVTG
jgi:IS30 family transposase